MKVVEKTGKTIESAVESALTELGANRENVEVEVLEEPSKGLFGFIKVKPARVKVTLKEGPSEKAHNLLKEIIDKIGIKADISIVEKEHGVFINMTGPDLGMLIGRRGETLDSLQYLVNLSVNKKLEAKKKVILDIEGYRNRREKTLQKLAQKLAEKVRQRGRNVVLEPMSSQERRIIHNALQGRDDIYTYSEGEEPYRKIVISPKR